METGIVRVVRALPSMTAAAGEPARDSSRRSTAGIIQASRTALHERRLIDRATGKMVNADLGAVRIAGAKGCAEDRGHRARSLRGRSSTDASGIGEPATVPTCAAIANAVAHATERGVRSLPITPARVLEALKGCGHESVTWIEPEDLDGRDVRGGAEGALFKAGGVDVEIGSRSTSTSRRRWSTFAVCASSTSSAPKVACSSWAAGHARNARFRRADPEQARALADAAAAAATPQIRNGRDAGRNLAQRRAAGTSQGDFRCRRKGGANASRSTGQNEMHAVFDNDLCADRAPERHRYRPHRLERRCC